MGQCSATCAKINMYTFRLQSYGQMKEETRTATNDSCWFHDLRRVWHGGAGKSCQGDHWGGFPNSTDGVVRTQAHSRCESWTRSVITHLAKVGATSINGLPK